MSRQGIASTLVGLLVFSGSFLFWFQGNGAGLLLGMSFVVGMIFALRVVPFSLALPVVTIWSMSIWLVGGVAYRAFFADMRGTGFGFASLTFAPLVVGLLVFLLFRRRPAVRAGQSHLRRRHGEALAACAGLFAVAYFVGRSVWNRGISGVAWTLSGDARNQIQEFGTQFTFAQTPTGLAYGMLAPQGTLFGMLAVVTSNPHPYDIGIYDHVIDTIWGMAIVTVIAIGLTGAASAALVLELAGRSATAKAPSWWVIGGASLAPLSGLAAGIGLEQGFITALLVIPVVTLALVLGVRVMRKDISEVERLLVCATLVIAIVLVTFLWQLIALPMVPLAVVAVVVVFVRGNLLTKVLVACASLTVALIALPIIEGWGGNAIRIGAFSNLGSIVAPSSMLLLFAPVVACVTFLSFPRTRFVRTLGPYLLATSVAISVVVVLVYSQPEGPSYVYYAAKVAWIWLSATLAIWFLPVARVAGMLSVLKGKATEKYWARASIGEHALVLSGVVLTLLVIQQVSPIASPFLNLSVIPRSIHSPVLDGWNFPNAAAVDVALRAGRRSQPTVIFGVLDPGNDRLANFVLDAFPQNSANDFKGWGYYAFGDVPGLCKLLVQDTRRIVITRDVTMRDQIITQCKIPNPQVEVIS